MAKCAVCKQEIQDGERFDVTSVGPVHVGQCSQYLSERTINESTAPDLAEVELL